MLGAEMDQEAGRKNRQKNQKDPKVKQDFEETNDTHGDAQKMLPNQVAETFPEQHRQSCLDQV